MDLGEHVGGGATKGSREVLLSKPALGDLAWDFLPVNN